MKSNKAVLISCFNYYDIRIKHVEKYLQENNFDVTYITSDFDHITKKVFFISHSNVIQVHAKPYTKNLSFWRIYSHYAWSRNAFKKVKEIKPEFLFVMLPPNSLAWYAACYKRNNEVRLVFDIYDLWPETYPFPKKSTINVAFYYWKQMRDKYLKYADLITIECDFYINLLRVSLDNTRVETLYPALDDVSNLKLEAWDEETMRIAYLGSINNIIDIPFIKKLIVEMRRQKPVHLHIIGSGESKSMLISAVKEAGATVTDHGVIFDSQEKQEILNSCKYGLNIMKESVCVGLTMKSIDYFRAGVPIINNIKGDTQWLVETLGIGINVVDSGSNDSLIITEESYVRMRINTRKAYCEIFSPNAFANRLSRILSKDIAENE